MFLSVQYGAKESPNFVTLPAPADTAAIVSLTTSSSLAICFLRPLPHERTLYEIEQRLAQTLPLMVMSGNKPLPGCHRHTDILLGQGVFPHSRRAQRDPSGAFCYLFAFVSADQKDGKLVDASSVLKRARGDLPPAAYAGGFAPKEGEPGTLVFRGDTYRDGKQVEAPTVARETLVDVREEDDRAGYLTRYSLTGAAYLEPYQNSRLRMIVPASGVDLFDKPPKWTEFVTQAEKQDRGIFVTELYKLNPDAVARGDAAAILKGQPKGQKKKKENDTEPEID